MTKLKKNQLFDLQFTYIVHFRFQEFTCSRFVCIIGLKNKFKFLLGQKNNNLSDPNRGSDSDKVSYLKLLRIKTSSLNEFV